MTKSWKRTPSLYFYGFVDSLVHRGVGEIFSCIQGRGCHGDGLVSKAVVVMVMNLFPRLWLSWWWTCFQGCGCHGDGLVSKSVVVMVMDLFPRLWLSW